MEANLGVGKIISKSRSREPEIFAIETFCGSMSLSRLSDATKYSATASKGSIVALIPILWTSESITESINAKLNER